MANLTRNQKEILNTAAEVLNEQSNVIDGEETTESLNKTAEVVNEILSRLGAGNLVVASKINGDIIGFVPMNSLPEKLNKQ